MTWRWSTALVWVVLSLLIGTLSGFALIALGVAGLVLIATLLATCASGWWR